MNKTIVVIEDEQQISQFISSSLAKAGFHAFAADSGQAGLTEAGTRKPDLILLDLGLPDIDGLQVIARLRAWSAVPIIVLSARSMEASKVAALDAGADDYLTKPFSVTELLARVRANLRRYVIAPGRPSSLVHFGEVDVDLEARSVKRAGVEIKLTPIEYRLLAELLRNAGRVVTHHHLLAAVWGPSFVEHAHYLRVYMGHLRQKLELDPTQPRHILTEVGVGYRFDWGMAGY